jgi:hypothetical protein
MARIEWLGTRSGWRAFPRRRWLYLPLALLLLAGILALALWFLAWGLVPQLLPQVSYYDLVANRGVTERLVDPGLFKVEWWEIEGQYRQVLFVHPGPMGSIAMVYPVKVEPGTTFRADLAVAPEAWELAGDGVTFSLYVEDEAGMHLLYSQYVDPKHQQQDQRWLPMEASLARFRGKLVRLILAVGPGPAGDQRYDWAGWGKPRLERPMWP